MGKKPVQNGAEGFDLLYVPDEQITRPMRLEEILLDRSLVTPQQIENAAKLTADHPGKSIGQALVESGAINETDLMACLAERDGLSFERLARAQVQDDAVAALPMDFLTHSLLLPLRITPEGTLVVATCEPANIFLHEEARRKAGGRPVDIVVATATDIRKVLGELNSNPMEADVDDLFEEMEEGVDDQVEIMDTQVEEIGDLEKFAGESPVIRFVNYLIYNAVRQGASDIHIEPGETTFKVRYRIDGVLFEQSRPSQSLHPAVISRLKIMSNLDISERRLPQDGRIQAMINNRHVDLRVSTLPVTHGEKAVIRILDNRSILLGLERLGMDEDTRNIFQRQIENPHGIVLVTGPTGSGKTTTLYSALRTMDGASLNISTVEDPVEYQLPFANQVQVSERIGMTFAAALRSLLRQDPDVIMVGEIRDEETARISVQASLTGHLVLSTLHTNDAPATITRLINIGVEPYLISASVNAVLAQRLARNICNHCKEPEEPDDQVRDFLQTQGLPSDKVFRGRGCDKCRKTGYSGRTGIYELLVLDDTCRDMIVGNPSVTELRRFCKERGMVNLREAGFAKVAAGVTTIDEILRVTESAI
ncbi:MAG: hypothetical protein BIFFINMI_04000 [Phycisphaerae bacterium]|nr:hypothetical protein [Phycisphaerae bacterium]